MSELFDKSIRTLELPRVLQLLADQAVSEEAKALALAVRPETDYEDVLRLLDQTDGARTMSALHGAPGFSGVKPVRELLASFMRTFAQRPENRRLHIYTECDRMD